MAFLTKTRDLNKTMIVINNHHTPYRICTIRIFQQQHEHFPHQFARQYNIDLISSAYDQVCIINIKIFFRRDVPSTHPLDLMKVNFIFPFIGRASIHVHQRNIYFHASTTYVTTKNAIMK